MAATAERFKALVENSSDAILLMREEGEVVYANTSTAKVLGYQPDELLGCNGLDLIHPEDRDHTIRLLQRVVVEPQFDNQMQARVRQKDGQWLWVESTARNLLDEPNVGAIVVNYREITRRRLAEEERQRYAEELDRSNAELQAFAHSVAHDLREPLRTISAFTELLMRRAQLDEANQELAQLVISGVRRMSTLLENLLSSAMRGSAAAPVPVELSQAVAEAMENLSEALTSSGAKIEVASLPTVQGNQIDLVRLFQNLIANSVKYRSKAPVEVRITAERHGPDWVIQVRDNGIGIPKEQHRHVFGLFTRLHAVDEIPGTGIGLALCKKIVEEMGGAIWVESELGAGSTFCFTLTAGPPTAVAQIAQA